MCVCLGVWCSSISLSLALSQPPASHLLTKTAVFSLVLQPLCQNVVLTRPVDFSGRLVLSSLSLFLVFHPVTNVDLLVLRITAGLPLCLFCQVPHCSTSASFSIPHIPTSICLPASPSLLLHSRLQLSLLHPTVSSSSYSLLPPGLPLTQPTTSTLSPAITTSALGCSSLCSPQPSATFPLLPSLHVQFHIQLSE